MSRKENNNKTYHQINKQDKYVCALFNEKEREREKLCVCEWVNEWVRKIRKQKKKYDDSANRQRKNPLVEYSLL